MRLKQKSFSRKNVHMAIQPMRQLQAIDRITSDKVSSPDAMLSENSSIFGNDPIIQKQGNENEMNGSSQSSDRQPSLHEQQPSLLQQDNNLESGDLMQKEQQIKDKLTQSYINDYYDFVLKPIAKNLISYSILFLLVFVMIKVLWISEEIMSRKHQEESYLKRVMHLEMKNIKKQYSNTFSFLDEVNELYSTQISSLKRAAQTHQDCSDFNQRYICNNNTNYNTQFYKAIDINYLLLSLHVGKLINQMRVSDVFVFRSDESLLQMNLSKIINEKFIQQARRGESIGEEAIRLLSQHINKQQLQNTQNTFDSVSFNSYLQSNNIQSYQIFQVYLYNQDSTQHNLNNYQSFYYLYCSTINLHYNTTSTKAKICLAIEDLSSPIGLQGVQNIKFIKTQSPKIQITSNKIIKVIYPDDTFEDFYKVFSNFISTEISPIYKQNLLEQTMINDCLQFQMDFYRMQEGEDMLMQILRCQSSEYLHLLVSKYVVAWGQIVLERDSYHNLAQKINVEDPYKINAFYISNVTYFKDVHQIASEGIYLIQLTCKIYASILILILFSYQTSKDIIRDKMMQSLFYIKRLAKLVLGIDQVKKSEKEFKIIIKEIEEKYKRSSTQIMGVLIEYLQKFLWIKKLYYFNTNFTTHNHKRKKNRLLQEGLTLFKYKNDKENEQINQQSAPFNNIRKSIKQIESQRILDSDALKNQNILINYSKYPGVLTYIYQQLISLELQKIQHFQNIKAFINNRSTSRTKKYSLKPEQINILKQIDYQCKEQKNQLLNQQNDKNDYYDRDQRKIQGEDILEVSIMDSKPREHKDVSLSNYLNLIKLRNQNKSQSKQHIVSNPSIGIRTSIKSIQSEVLNSANENQRGENSVHDGVESIKLNQKSNIQSQINLNPIYSSLLGSSLSQQQSMEPQSTNQFHFKDNEILYETLATFERISHYYQELIEIKLSNLQRMSTQKMLSYQQQQNRINELYSIEIKRMKTCSNYLRLLLEENPNTQTNIQSKINLNFQHLSHYQTQYEILPQLIQESTLYKMNIAISLGKTIPYKQLQELKNSQNLQVSLQSTLLYAEELQKLSPFLNFEVINSCLHSLSNEKTSNCYKTKCIQLMINALDTRKEQFFQEIEQLQAIKKYYNRKHKKFYFIADMSESSDIFTPILTKIYQTMGKMDLMQIYNLSMNQNLQDMQLLREIIKPHSCQKFLSLFQKLSIDSQKSKEKNSSKMIHKRFVYEKDFNQILDEIEKDETDFSSFLVVILGGDQLPNHSILTDDVDSSSNQRQMNQLLHSEINRKMEQNYHHIIEIGSHLNNFLTKQGKLKKHIKNCKDLLEVDLTKKNMNQHFLEIEKFVNQ